MKIELTPKMYDYFRSKGIEVKNNEIQHWIDKKVVKGSIRVFFLNTFSQDTQCFITAKGFFGVQLYYAKLDLKNDISWFHIDIPASRYLWITKYEVIVQKDNKVIWTETVKKIGASEHLI